MRLHNFDPATMTVRSGEAVRWENRSLIWHTVTADPTAARQPEHASVPAGASTFDSGKVSPGQNYVHAFDVPGTYRYFCRPHEAHGMTGTIVVEPRP